VLKFYLQNQKKEQRHNGGGKLISINRKKIEIEAGEKGGGKKKGKVTPVQGREEKDRSDLGSEESAASLAESVENRADRARGTLRTERGSSIRCGLEHV